MNTYSEFAKINLLSDVFRRFEKMQLVGIVKKNSKGRF